MCRLLELLVGYFGGLRVGVVIIIFPLSSPIPNGVSLEVIYFFFPRERGKFGKIDDEDKRKSFIYFPAMLHGSYPNGDKSISKGPA